MDWGPIIGGYIGLALLGAALSAIGVAASASTKIEVISLLLAFGVSVVPFVMGYVLKLCASRSTTCRSILEF